MPLLCYGVLTGSRCGCWLSCLGRLRSHDEGRRSWQLHASGGGWRLGGASWQVGQSCWSGVWCSGCCRLWYNCAIAEEGKVFLFCLCFLLPHPPESDHREWQISGNPNRAMPHQLRQSASSTQAQQQRRHVPDAPPSTKTPKTTATRSCVSRFSSSPVSCRPFSAFVRDARRSVIGLPAPSKTFKLAHRPAAGCTAPPLSPLLRHPCTRFRSVYIPYYTYTSRYSICIYRPLLYQPPLLNLDPPLPVLGPPSSSILPFPAMTSPSP